MDFHGRAETDGAVFTLWDTPKNRVVDGFWRKNTCFFWCFLLHSLMFLKPFWDRIAVTIGRPMKKPLFFVLNCQTTDDRSFKQGGMVAKGRPLAYVFLFG